MRGRPAVAIALALLAVGAVVLVAAEGGWLVRTTPPPTTADFVVKDVTPDLGPVFAQGAPQAFAFNSSVVLVTGVVGDPVTTTVPYPLLGSLGGLPNSPSAANLSSEVGGLFHGGDTLGVAWNGTAWLITGEAAWGSSSGGAAAAWSNGRWTNLTPMLRPYFSGQGGIWFDAWNGSAWLLGGQSDQGAALVEVQGSTVHDLSPELPNNHPNQWIQFLAWNGTAWLVGGKGVFGVLEGPRYVDLLPGSPFAGGGMFAADWNGSAWLAGGGSPGAVTYVVGDHLAPAPRLPSSYTWWVNSVTWDGRGWFVGGEGGTAGLPYDSALVYLDATSGVVVPLSGELPPAFSGGQVEFGALAPFFGTGTVLLIGQGGLQEPRGSAGPSTGAAATVVRV